VESKYISLTFESELSIFRITRVDRSENLPSLAAGVGNNEHSLSDMREAKPIRLNNFPFRIIPEAGQGPENSVNSIRNEPWHVLQDDVSGSYLANNSGEFKEQTSSSTIQPFFATGRD